jgi:hypothetical protein
MTTDLFRAVSMEELDDIRRIGRLRSAGSSCEGKQLATTIDDAQRWGRALYRDARFAVVRVTVSRESLEQFDKWDRLDGIGSAFFATIQQLMEAQVSEVIL